jgi:two-component system sensor histidine kinase TctE
MKRLALAPGMSLVAKFLEWLAAPMLFLWLATAFVGLFMMAGAAERPYDEELGDLALALASRVEPTGQEDGSLRLAADAQRWLATDRIDQLNYAIRRDDGVLLSGEAEVSPVPGAMDASRPTFHGGVVGGEPVRIASVAVAHPLRPDARIVVQVAETLNKRQRLARQLHAQSLVPQLFVLAGAFALVWYGLGYVIAPMQRLNTLIDHRDSADLSPLPPAAAPPELQPLIAAINGLMARLAASFEAQHRFIADAAHQLRTPLAGLRTQTELALAQRDPDALRESLVQLDASTQRAIHLANRLLSLARAGTHASFGRQAVDLVVVARETVADWFPRAVDQGVDLGFEAPDAEAAAVVRGDPLLLRELLSNLIDNAIRYTGRGGTVTVLVGAPPACELVVVDNGPGIAEGERERLLEPFARGGHAAMPGTGLGLTIVDEIARGHGAKLELLANVAGPGLRAVVRFAPSEPPAAE